MEKSISLRRFLPQMSMLCAFEASARLQSFTAAAAELNLTQSAVSRQIRALEETLGSDLFLRERKTVRLTSAGRAYAQEIRGALKRISAATHGFRANPQGGVLNLAILPTFGVRWLAPRLPLFIAENPGVTINLTTRLTPFDFAEEPIDAAIHFGSAEWPGAKLDFLMRETVVPACSREMLRVHQFKEAGDLLKAPLLHLASRADAWTRWFRSMNVEVADVQGMLVDQFAVAAQAAMSSLGVALLPKFLIEGELARGDLVEAIHRPVDSVEHYYLAWPSSRASYPPLQSFRNWLQSAVGAQPGH